MEKNSCSALGLISIVSLMMNPQRQRGELIDLCILLLFFGYINQGIYYRPAVFHMVELPLLVFHPLQASGGRPSCGGRRGAVGPGTSTAVFMPEPQCHISTDFSSDFHLDFATEGASVLSMLANFNVLYHFPERSNNNRSHIDRSFQPS